jgi:hypothetical protein
MQSLVTWAVRLTAKWVCQSIQNRGDRRSTESWQRTQSHRFHQQWHRMPHWLLTACTGYSPNKGHCDSSRTNHSLDAAKGIHWVNPHKWFKDIDSRLEVAQHRSTSTGTSTWQATAHQRLFNNWQTVSQQSERFIGFCVSDFMWESRCIDAPTFHLQTFLFFNLL